MSAPEHDDPGTILVVEDDADIRTSLVEFLEDEGHRVQCAASGEEALRLLDRTSPPALVLLDLFMPRMDGAAFLRALEREHGDAMAGVPIVVVSAAPPGNDLRRRIGARAAAYVAKPIDLDALLSIVREHAR